MCYNVLCDKYATRQMYGYCPSWALEWDYRKKGILDEIRHYSADIISLQASHTCYIPVFPKRKKNSIFFSNTTRLLIPRRLTQKTTSLV